MYIYKYIYTYIQILIYIHILIHAQYVHVYLEPVEALVSQHFIQSIGTVRVSVCKLIHVYVCMCVCVCVCRCVCV